MQNTVCDPTEERVIGDDWFFNYSLYDAPDVTPIAVEPEPTFYLPDAPVAPVVAPALVSQDLTGFVAKGYLIVTGRDTVQVITDAQSDDNALSKGQFRIIVPSSITRGLSPSQFGVSPVCRLHVTLTDARNYVETIESFDIRVVAP